MVVRGGSVKGEPKSETSRRLISLSTNIVCLPHYHLKNQLEMFEALGIPWTEDCYLFYNDQCEPTIPTQQPCVQTLRDESGFSGRAAA